MQDHVIDIDVQINEIYISVQFRKEKWWLKVPGYKVDSSVTLIYERFLISYLAQVPI